VKPLIKTVASASSFSSAPSPSKVPSNPSGSSEFSRYLVEADGSGAALETAVMKYSLPATSRASAATSQERQDPNTLSVHLFSAVHLGDKGYFEELERQLLSYDRVLYELVADKEGSPEGQRWQPPGPSPSHTQGQETPTSHEESKKKGLVGQFQGVMAQALELQFQLDNLNYRQDHWYHADLDLLTFKRLSSEKQESLLSLGRNMFKLAAKSIWSGLWAKTADSSDVLKVVQLVVPMPMVAQLVISGWLHQKDSTEDELPASTLAEQPVPRALLSLDIIGGIKHFLAQQLCDDSLSTLEMSKSVIIGERNAACMTELRSALDAGCTNVAILYGGAHLPDMGRRLESDFGGSLSEVDWIRAWDLPFSQSEIERQSSTHASNGRLPLGKVQSVALLGLSVILATDLYVWESVVKYIGHVLVT